MANGTAAVRFLNPPSAPVPPVEKREAALVQEKIGTAMASAVCAICQGVFELQGGALSPATKDAGGTRIAALYTLQQAHTGEISFEVVAREQGLLALRQHFAEDGFYRRYSAEQGDAVLDLFIDDVLGVLDKVTAFERAWAN